MLFITKGLRIALFSMAAVCLGYQMYLIWKTHVKTLSLERIDTNVKIESRLWKQEISENEKITITNPNYFILNDKVFPSHDNFSLIIVVQVEHEIKYLKKLIESLSKAENISSALLIFSHGFYDKEMVELVQQIKFCQVLQIFFPYSLQNFPDTFPGKEPNDCPQEISKQEAIKRKCNGADSPDSYGRYRLAEDCQIKHHWWWKINYVFDTLLLTKNFFGPFLFLEDGHYVLPDFIYVLHSMETYCKRFDNCRGMSLGMPKAKLLCPSSLKVHLGNKPSDFGLVLYRSTWEGIKKCSWYFCIFDSYRWDFGLLYAARKCLKNQFYFMVLECSPRVVHVGECFHHSINECLSNVDYIDSRVAEIQSSLHPTNLLLRKQVRIDIETVSGGWSDKRDIEMCLLMANITRGQFIPNNTVV